MLAYQYLSYIGIRKKIRNITSVTYLIYKKTQTITIYIHIDIFDENFFNIHVSCHVIFIITTTIFNSYKNKIVFDN